MKKILQERCRGREGREEEEEQKRRRVKVEGDGGRKGERESQEEAAGEKEKGSGPWGECRVAPVLILVIKTFQGGVKWVSSTPLKLPLQAHLSTDE